MESEGGDIAEPAIAAQSISTYASESTISVNRDIRGNFSGTAGGKEEIYYKFSLPSKGTVSLDFAHESIEDNNKEWYIELLTANKTVVGSWWHTHSGELKSSYAKVGLNAGTYYVHVYASYNADSYKLRVNYASSTDWETKPNNTTSTATPVSPNKPWNGSISTMLYHGNDVDYYKITLDKSARLSLDCEEINSIQDNQYSWITFSLRNENDEQLKYLDYYSYNGIKQVLDAGVVPAGTYYIKVNAGRSERTYKITPHVYTGAASTGWQSINGHWYYLDGNGKMATGWQNIDGNRYYFSDTGEMQQNWLNDRGYWYWLGADGAMRTAWQSIGGAWYWFASDGKMQTGWQSIAGGWYWMDAEGRMATGWHKVSGTWYLFTNGGTMQTNWQYVDGAWYWLGSNGAMRTGWQSIGGYWYYFDTSSGAMQTGWFKVGYNTWYYSNAAGQMQANCWVGDYYLTSSGKMATSTWIGPYHVGSDGRWDNR